MRKHNRSRDDATAKSFPVSSGNGTFRNHLPWNHHARKKGCESEPSEKTKNKMKDIVVPRIWEVTPRKDAAEEHLKREWNKAQILRLTKKAEWRTHGFKLGEWDRLNDKTRSL